MERVPEALQLPVIVEGRRPLALELQPLEKLDLRRGRRAAERRILKEFLEPGLFADRLVGFLLDKRESLRLPWDDAVVEDNRQTERRKVDVPGFNQRIQERDAVLSGHVEDVRIEELEHDDPHLLIAAATELSHHTEPVVILEFVFRHALDHVQQRLGDETFELAEGLLFKDCGRVFASRDYTCAGSARELRETRGRARPPIPASILPCAGDPPAWPVPRSEASRICPCGHRCPCGSARGALFSGSVTGRCRIRSRWRRARALAAPIPIPPAGAGSQTVRPQGLLRPSHWGLTSQVL